jgi:hypothetical protein
MKTRLLYSLDILTFDFRFHTITTFRTLSIALGLPVPTEEATVA